MIAFPTAHIPDPPFSNSIRYFYDRDPALAAIGPILELPDYNWLRRKTYWLRY